MSLYQVECSLRSQLPRTGRAPQACARLAVAASRVVVASPCRRRAGARGGSPVVVAGASSPGPARAGRCAPLGAPGSRPVRRGAAERGKKGMRSRGSLLRRSAPATRACPPRHAPLRPLVAPRLRRWRSGGAPGADAPAKKGAAARCGAPWARWVPLSRLVLASAGRRRARGLLPWWSCLPWRAPAAALSAPLRGAPPGGRVRLSVARVNGSLPRRRPLARLSPAPLRGAPLFSLRAPPPGAPPRWGGACEKASSAARLGASAPCGARRGFSARCGGR